MKSLRVLANYQKNQMLKAHYDLYLALATGNNRTANAIVRLTRPVLQNRARIIVNQAKALGLHRNKYKPNTPEYYSLLINLINEALAKSPARTVRSPARSASRSPRRIRTP